MQSECGIEMGGKPLQMVFLTSKRNKYTSSSLAHNGGYNLTRALWLRVSLAEWLGDGGGKIP